MTKLLLIFEQLIILKPNIYFATHVYVCMEVIQYQISDDQVQAQQKTCLL